MPRGLAALAVAATFGFSAAPPAVAQTTIQMGDETIEVPEGTDVREFMKQRAAAMQNGGGPPQPDDDKPDGEGGDEKKTEGEGEQKAGDERPAIIKRPNTPPKEDAGYDDRTFFSPDADGKYSPNFRGAPWPAVLTQLADVSGLSLDWQELPGDYLNLRTQREYTAEEARDLINRHLLARGFTLLKSGEILTVVNVSKLDPGAVPSVEPAELDDLQPHSFVKCVFALEWLPADRAAEELKALLSPRGKLTALPGSNRILAMDSVKNLRQLAAIIDEEQAGRGKERLFKQVRLRHIRADRAKELLEEFLGIGEDENALPSDPRMAQQMMQMRMQQQQKNKAEGGKEEPEIRLIVNDRENAVVIQAPPEKMAVIEGTIEALDVPRDPGEGLLAKMVLREDPVRIYRLARLDPELVVRLLSNSGELDPLTRVEVDKKGNALVVNGSPTDHLVISKLIESLDGTDRNFEVIPLRRLPADYVAGTVKFMMGVAEEEDDGGSRRSRYSYFSYGYGSSRGGDDEQEAEGEFRVDADVQNNRLLLWCNEVELEEVRALLLKLGEIRPAGAGRRPSRVLDVTEEQAAEILDRLKTTWPRVRNNPLDLPPPRPEPAPEPDPPATVDPDANVTAAPRPAPAVRTAALRQDVPAASRNGPAAPAAAAVPGEGPPVVIRRTTDGRLVIESDDLDALDALEDLAADLTPPQRDFHIFKLQHTDSAVWLVLQLEDFFAAETEQEIEYDYWGDPIAVPEKSPDRLSKRKKLRFIGDSDTRTILVQNASPSQLRQIGDLLKVWDQSPEQRGGSLRLTKVFDLKNAQAEAVAATLKDVYRDLLSTNDPALKSEKDDEKGGGGANPAYTYVYGRGSNKGEDEASPDPPIRFKGLLSVGVHQESNTLVISASEGLMANVEVLVAALEDNARQADAASYMWQGGPTAEGEIKTRLKEMFGESVTIAPAGGEPVRVGETRTLGAE